MQISVRSRDDSDKQGIFSKLWCEINEDQTFFCLNVIVFSEGEVIGWRSKVPYNDPK
jgi:hypothetical protein